LNNYLNYPNLSNFNILVKIVCGDHHTLALTDKGKIYTWGLSIYYQLNPNLDEGDVFSPIMVNDSLLFVILSLEVIERHVINQRIL